MPWIHRAGAQADFAMIPNATLRDRRLSYAARGVLAEILSRPDDWKTCAASMAAQAGKVGEGRYGMGAIFRELRAAGYVYYELGRGPGGRFITHVHFYDAPRADPGAIPADHTGSRSTAGRSAGTPPPVSPPPGSPRPGSPRPGRRPPGGPPAGTLAGRGSSRRPTTKTENEDRPDKDVVDGQAGARPGGDDDALITIVIEELAALNRTVTRAAAAEAVRRVLAGRDVKPGKEGAYLRRAIRDNPSRYLPAAQPPPPPPRRREAVLEEKPAEAEGYLDKIRKRGRP